MSDQPPQPSNAKRILRGLVALLAAAAVWLPCVHFLYQKPAAEFHAEKGLSPRARELAARHLQLWTEPELRKKELQRMRASNAEWDFMGRSFLVWSLANICLREPAMKAQCLPVIDQIIEETIKLEKSDGIYVFLMPYAKASQFKAQPPRSLFIDGEIALMLAARRVVEEKTDYKPLLDERIKFMIERMESSPVLGAESYPDECWTYDHAVALAALKVADHLDGTDHTPLIQRWLTVAKEKLVHKESGLLISSYTKEGRIMDGPEGSTIWLVAHCLAVIDPEFARGQYQRARKELGRTLLGFGFAREWPKSAKGTADIDSGPIIPVLEISAGSSGMAFIGAATFGDWDYVSSLAASLDMGGFPIRENGRLRYCASNQVGDAAMLYATVLGPLWESVKKKGKP